jgi:CheY-like chemotaxis protein
MADKHTAKRILIVDDEEHIRRVIRITLESAGYLVDEAADGPDSLKIFGDGSRWDCVVLDQKMPGMSGLTVLQRIKEIQPSARVVMATAYASIEIAVDAMKLGATDFVRKPMTPEILRNAVAAALAKGLQAIQTKAIAPESIQTLTMNGFTILDEEDDDNTERRKFLVVTPQGERTEVVVNISANAIDYIARMIQRRLPPESSFWTEEARRLLGDHLWLNSKLPEGREINLDDVGRDKIGIAERWKD